MGVSDLCEIEAEEVHLLSGVAPVNIAVPEDGVRPIAIHALYAVSPPPPADAPGNAAGEEEEEDVYDWYTFPRAMSALSADPYARAALATMACTLAAGAAGGTVPSQWGGVFGQEWTGPALRLLPGIDGGLELEKGTRTVDGLIELEKVGQAKASAKTAAEVPNSSNGKNKRQRVES